MKSRFETDESGNIIEARHAPRKSAIEKMMDHLARRGLSELELRRKLSRDYDEDDVNEAVAKAKASNWLQSPESLSERYAEDLNQKRKGHRFINQYLAQKGLPSVTEDPEVELAKARTLLQLKLKHDFDSGEPFPRDLHAKAQRLLYTRGFSSDTIRRVLS